MAALFFGTNVGLKAESAGAIKLCHAVITLVRPLSVIFYTRRPKMRASPSMANTRPSDPTLRAIGMAKVPIWAPMSNTLSPGFIILSKNASSGRVCAPKSMICFVTRSSVNARTVPNIAVTLIRSKAAVELEPERIRLESCRAYVLSSPASLPLSLLMQCVSLG